MKSLLQHSLIIIDNSDDHELVVELNTVVNILSCKRWVNVKYILKYFH